MRIDHPTYVVRRMDDSDDHQDDAALWRDIAAGRPAAFARLMDQHGARFLAHALAVSGDRNLAEDAVQDVLLLLVERPALIAGISHPPGYVARMVRNRAIDLMRRQGRAVSDSAALADLALVAPGPDADADQAARLNAALAQLPPEQREVVTLKIVHGLTFAAIAETTGTTLNTAASRYRYALEKLTHLLEDPSHDS